MGLSWTGHPPVRGKRTIEAYLAKVGSLLSIGTKGLRDVATRRNENASS